MSGSMEQLYSPHQHVLLLHIYNTLLILIPSSQNLPSQPILHTRLLWRLFVVKITILGHRLSRHILPMNIIRHNHVNIAG